jgi:D-psicose/D-tagatose/L-ribulose 3-epimerase
MKIGFCMLLWATRITPRHRPIMQALQKTGYDGVEIPAFAGKPKDYAALGRILDDLGLARTVITAAPPGHNPASADKAERAKALDYLRWLVDCTVAVGADAAAGPIQQTLGYFSGKSPTVTEWRRSAAVLRKAGDYSRDAGVTLVVEAVNRFEIYLMNTMDDLSRFIRLVDHPNVRPMYDTFHANIEEADPVAALARHVSEFAHVHISENDRGVPGRGHVPWKETFATLKRGKYDGWLTIEAFGRGLPELAAAARVWRDFAESPEAVYRDGYKFIRKSWDAAPGA